MLRNARIVLPDRCLEGDVVLEGDRIAALRPPGTADGPEVWDLDGRTVAPGRIDLHTHGGWGVDFARDSAERMAGVARDYARSGTTRLLITLVPAPADELCARLAVAAEACALSPAFIGIHLEGPFLARDRRGALPEAGIVEWDATLFERVVAAAAGRLRVMTFAPEVIPAGELRRIQSHGVILSIGHTSSDAATCETALRNGVRRATHLCNAMPLMHHRDPGPVLPLLLDRRARVELIVDGEHLADSLVELVLRVKGDAGVIAVSDSIPLTGQGDGRGTFAGAPVEVRDGVARRPDGALAGSAVPLEAALRRLGAALGLDASSLALLGAANPAADLELLGMGRIGANARADLLIQDIDGGHVAVLRDGVRADEEGELLPETVPRLA